jgi:GntR family transcriptional regulator of vanillate catabolism
MGVSCIHKIPKAPDAAMSTKLARAKDFSVQAHAHTRALLTLREWIVSGALRGGERIAEMPLVERLGVSRTPVRAALQRLELEGLLHALPAGGYVVRQFTYQDMADTIEMRGLLEGLGARWSAERGAPLDKLSQAKSCLSDLDAVFDLGQASELDLSAYAELNARFHRLVMEMSNSSALQQEYERTLALPFASPSALVLNQDARHRTHTRFLVAQDQHWQVLDAIERRQGARAEALMREHAGLAQRNLKDSMNDSGVSTADGEAVVKWLRPPVAIQT